MVVSTVLPTCKAGPPGKEMQMRWKLWTSLFVLGLTIGNVFAQDAVPPTGRAGDTRVVRERIGHTGGDFGYCTP